MLTKKKINQNIFKIFFFAFIYLLGLNIFKDYGIYADDEYQRNNAFAWYTYIKSFAIELNFSFIGNLEKLVDNDIENITSSTIPSLQPVPLGIICEFFVDLFNITGSKDIYQFRHLFNFSIFFIGLFFFYKLIFKRFSSIILALVGVVFLFLTPRFFAESFYNSQDIFFLTLTIINIYTGFNFLKKPSLQTTLIFSLSSALSLDTRIMAFLPIFLILVIFILKCVRSTKFYKNYIKYIFYFVPTTAIFILVFWPYLWINPITNFIFAISELSSAAFLVSNLYFGKLILSTNIPSHYHIVWFFITTPLIIIFLFIIGSFLLLLRLLKRLNKLNNDSNDIWRGDKEMYDIYFFMLILISNLIFINKGLGYTGWRHLYFMYPSVIMIYLYSIYFFNFILKNKIIVIILYLLVIINLSYLAFWNYKFHPYQYVYFNLLNKKNFHKNFDMDYWALSNKNAISYILKNHNNFPVKVGTISFASLQKSLLILDETEKNKIIVTHNLKEADFLITNYMEKRSGNFIIDKKKYEKFHEILVDDKPINTVYKKKN